MTGDVSRRRKDGCPPLSVGLHSPKTIRSTLTIPSHHISTSLPSRRDADFRRESLSHFPPGQRRAPSNIGAVQVLGPGSDSPLSELGIAVLPAMAASHRDKVTTMRHPPLQRPPDHQWNSGGRSNSDVCLSNTTAPLLARHFFSCIPAIHLWLDSTR